MICVLQIIWATVFAISISGLKNTKHHLLERTWRDAMESPRPELSHKLSSPRVWRKRNRLIYEMLFICEGIEGLNWTFSQTKIS